MFIITGSTKKSQGPMYDIQQEVVYLGLKQPFWDKFPGCYFDELLLGNLPKWASIGSTDTRQIGVFFLHLMSTDHGAQSLTISWRTFRQLGGNKMSPWHQFHRSVPNWVDMPGKTKMSQRTTPKTEQEGEANSAVFQCLYFGKPVRRYSPKMSLTRKQVFLINEKFRMIKI